MADNSKKKQVIKTHMGHFVASRIPVVMVSTSDDDRFFKNEQRALEVRSRMEKVYRWDSTTHIIEAQNHNKGTIDTIRNTILWFVRKRPESFQETGNLVTDGAPRKSALFLFDAGYYLQVDSRGQFSNVALTREIKNCMSDLIAQEKTIFLVGLYNVIPPELANCVPLFEYPPPDVADMKRLIESICPCFATEEEKKKDAAAGLKIEPDALDELARTLAGMTEVQAKQVLVRAATVNFKNRANDPTVPREFDKEFILQEKASSSQSNDSLAVYMPPKKGSDFQSSIGGMDPLKKWSISRISQMVRHENMIDGGDRPKGAILFGMGGTGKDAFVLDVANATGLTTVHMDLGATRNQLQGESHRRFRQAIKYAEEMAPSILVFSELEKMLAGAMNPDSAVCDGGTGSEIFATWLNWMQNRTAPVFVFGLTNNISQLSQPAIRAGRWDKVWFVDLPGKTEREEIFRVILRDMNWDVSGMDITQLAEMTEGAVGGEIRAIINDAISYKTDNFGNRNECQLSQAHLIEGIKMNPNLTGKTRRGEVEALRAFAQAGGYPLANSPSMVTSGAATIADDIANAVEGDPEMAVVKVSSSSK